MARLPAATNCTAVLEEADHALTRLPPDEEVFLRLRFGIGDRRQSTAGIARRMGLRPEDIQNLESRALTHLRQFAIQAQLLRQASEA